MDGALIRDALCVMDERGSGDGSGYVAYGAFPDYANLYAIHVFYDKALSKKEQVEAILHAHGTIEHNEEIRTHDSGKFPVMHTPWRYFFKPNADLATKSPTPEDDIVARVVFIVNTSIDGAIIYSSGKDIAVFKASGWPQDVADFYRIEDYEGYMWLAHNRYPTNSPGWWGGAHPFNFLNWSVVHNGEITSYGTNKRYLESHGYKCTLLTDTEVVAYLTDFLVRKHALPLSVAATVLAPPFWEEIERMPEHDKANYTALRETYGSAMMNGPFAIAVASQNTLMALTDRIKLRPLVTAERDGKLFVASEEAAIRSIEPNISNIRMPHAGEPVIGRVVA
jgi:glutamate synthase domain-containing protein 1